VVYTHREWSLEHLILVVDIEDVVLLDFGLQLHATDTTHAQIVSEEINIMALVAATKVAYTTGDSQQVAAAAVEIVKHVHRPAIDPHGVLHVVDEVVKQQPLLLHHMEEEHTSLV